MLQIDELDIPYRISISWMRQTHWSLVNIESGNGLVLPGNMPLRETNIESYLRRYMASLGHTELKSCPIGGEVADMVWDNTRKGGPLNIQ